MISPPSISAIFETRRFMNSRSCEVISNAPGNDLRNCSSQMMDSMSRWFVGSSISNTSGIPGQDARQRNAHFPSARESAHVAVNLIVFESETMQHFAGLRFERVTA